MSCEHCVKAVTKAVTALSGTGGVSIDLEAGTVAVEHDPALAPLGKIRSVIEELGYDLAE
jgi:copper chaperone